MEEFNETLGRTWQESQHHFFNDVTIHSVLMRGNGAILLISVQEGELVSFEIRYPRPVNNSFFAVRFDDNAEETFPTIPVGMGGRISVGYKIIDKSILPSILSRMISSKQMFVGITDGVKILVDEITLEPLKPLLRDLKAPGAHVEIPDYEPAFPKTGAVGKNNEQLSPEFTGMLLRDYFAAKAMQGLLSSGNNSPEIGNKQMSIQEASYIIADAMLKARNGSVDRKSNDSAIE